MLPRVDVLVLNPAGLCLIKSCITIIAFLVYHQQRMDQNCGMSQDECWNRMSISSMHSNYDQAQNLHLLNQCLIKNFATDGLRIQKLTISYSSFHSNPNPQKEKRRVQNSTFFVSIPSLILSPPLCLMAALSLDHGRLLALSCFDWILPTKRFNSTLFHIKIIQSTAY